ncbi:MAG TPA: VanZ family protein [Allosphingosinicella sp.]|jgi:VanZ family protein
MKLSPPTKLLILAFWSAAAFALVMALLPKPPQAPVGDKVQHMIAFAALASLASHAYYRASLLKIGLCLAGFGALIEILQSIPALGRDASVMDLVADCAAIAVVLTVARLRN